MMTTLGSTTLVDGDTYTSINGRVYLPDLHNNGQYTEFYVRNNGTEQRNIQEYYFYTNGNPTPKVSDVCILGPNQWCVIPVWDFNRIPVGSTGSAYIDGGENVSVAVTQKRFTLPASGGAYVGLSNAQMSSTFYVPLAMRQVNGASGLTNSQIMIQNASSSSSVSFQIQMIAAPGSGFANFTKSVTLSAAAAYHYLLVNELPANLPNGWYGSAVVSTSGGTKKIAVVSNLFSGSDMVQIFNTFPAESVGTTWLVPLFASRLTNGLNTPVAVQNLSSTTIPVGGVTLSCTPDPGSSGSTSFTKQNNTAISPNAAYYFNPVTDLTIPANWYGSCRITASQNVVSFVQMRFVNAGNTASAAAYEALRTNSTDKQAIFPLIQRQPNSTSLATAVTIQNLSSTSAANVTLNYYGSSACPGSGNLSASFPIPAGGSLIRNHRIGHDIPVGWCGSLLVTSSNQPIHGFIQLTDLNSPLGAGDTLMTHNATTQP